MEGAIDGLAQLWNENQETILSLLQDVAKTAKHRHIKDTITNAVTGLNNVRRLDPDKIRIAVSGTSGEAAVGATNQKFCDRLRSKSNGPVSDVVASEPANQTGTLARLKQKFIRSITKTTHFKHSENISITEGAGFPSSPSQGRSDEALSSSSLDSENPTNLAIPVLLAGIGKSLRIGTLESRGSIPTMIKDPGKQDKGTVKLTRDVLCDDVLSTSFHPEMARLKLGAQSCMTESLNEMAALAHRAATGALEECHEVIEKLIEVQESNDTKQLQAETLERLVCWGNLVSAHSVIQEMKRLIDEPVVGVLVPPSRASSTLLFSPVSSFAGSLSPRSQSPSPSLSKRMYSTI